MYIKGGINIEMERILVEGDTKMPLDSGSQEMKNQLLIQSFPEF